jgi:hypothetical protein
MWRLQVKTAQGWQDVRQAGSDKPYECTTENEALKVLAMCYPKQVREYVYLGAEQTVRVKEYQ